jgi:hypothetical protein
MIDKSGGLFECSSTNSLLLFILNQPIDEQHYTLRIIYRPLVRRTTS